MTLAFGQDGRTLAAGCLNGTAVIWQAAASDLLLADQIRDVPEDEQLRTIYELSGDALSLTSTNDREDLRTWQAAIESATNVPSARFALADLYCNRARELAISPDTSIADASEAVTLNLRFVLGWQRKAVALDATGRSRESLEAWDAGAELAPQNIQVWNGRGLTLVALGRDVEAASSFDEALAIDPRFSLARFNKAEAEQRLDRPADAAKSYQQFLSLAPPHLASQIQEARRKLEELKST